MEILSYDGSEGLHCVLYMQFNDTHNILIMYINKPPSGYSATLLACGNDKTRILELFYQSTIYFIHLTF